MIDVKKVEDFEKLTDSLESIATAIENMPTPSGVEVTGEASGTVVTFNDGSANPLKSLVVDINPVQAGSGTPAPDNVRPISGWSNVEVTVADDTTDPTTEETYEISLGQTVYGGKLNVTTGELTVTHKKAVIDEDTNITIGSSGMSFKAEVLTGVEPVSSSSQLTGTICDSLNEVTQASTWGTEYTFARVSTTELVYFKLDNATTTIEQCKEYLQNNPLSFVYKLKEENYITYNLTPTQVSSLLGSNNIWADTGDSNVVYIRDINTAFNILWNAVMI